MASVDGHFELRGLGHRHVPAARRLSSGRGFFGARDGAGGTSRDQTLAAFSEVVEVMEHVGQPLPAPSEAAIEGDGRRARTEQHPQLDATEVFDLAGAERLEGELVAEHLSAISGVVGRVGLGIGISIGGTSNGGGCPAVACVRIARSVT